MENTDNNAVYKAQLGLITARFVAFSDMLYKSNDTKFTKTLCINRQSMSAMRNKKGNVNLEQIIKLINNHSDISIEWLFRGTGDMFLHNRQNIDQANAHIIGNNMSPNGQFSQLDPAVSEVLTKQANQIDRLIAIIEHNKSK